MVFELVKKHWYQTSNYGVVDIAIIFNVPLCYPIIKVNLFCRWFHMYPPSFQIFEYLGVYVSNHAHIYILSIFPVVVFNSTVVEQIVVNSLNCMHLDFSFTCALVHCMYYVSAYSYVFHVKL